MARQFQTREFNTFVKGLITEASPLTFPDNASLEEENFVLERDGSRSRRFGIDYEGGHSLTVAGSPLDLFSSYRWKEASGAGTSDVLVVHMGTDLYFFDTEGGVPYSPNLIHTEDLLTISKDYKGDASAEVKDEDTLYEASFAKVGKRLVVACNSREVKSFTYEGGSITTFAVRLKARDLFGVEDKTAGGVDLNSGKGLTTRPTIQTDAHNYNLRNQSWSLRYLDQQDGDAGVKKDPLVAWKSLHVAFPANADVVTRAVYPDVTLTNRTVDRFWPDNLFNTDYGLSQPARGSMIVDFLERGRSRLYEVGLVEDDSDLSYNITTLPIDETQGGASSVASYAGRAFYSGFDRATPTTKDEKSPATESFVLFSKLISTDQDLSVCYQEGDPTGRTNPDLLATDGGFIVITDADTIHTLLPIGQSLFAIADNGVWEIRGGSDYGFAADNFLVTRITDKGAISTASVVDAEDTIFYWGDEGIFQVVRDESGNYGSVDITKNTIQEFYYDISAEDRLLANGAYDPYSSKVLWVYPDGAARKEISLDTVLSAYSINSFSVIDTTAPYPRGLIQSPYYTVSENFDQIVVEGDPVVADGELVGRNISVRDTGFKNTLYVSRQLSGGGEASFTFATLGDAAFLDWVTYDSVGLDAKAFLLTGTLSGVDHSRKRQVPTLSMFFRRSETGFEEDIGGDWLPVNPSSCLASSQWEWTDSANSGKWSNPFQAYRLQRHFFPAEVTDPFDNGFAVVVTKNKLRGRGRTLSLLIESEEGFDMQLLGWSMLTAENGNV